ncbi:MAG: AraC family transcriptional regulator [Burkholderiaceae bacterium]|nr:AraC family transcriptional regulator [Burkholderiaceae bacterium]
MQKSEATHKTMQVRAAVLSHYEELAGRLGLNPQPLLREVGLTRQMLTVRAQLIPLNSAVRLLELSAQAAACDTFGLLMAEARVLSDFGPISLLLMQQPTMRGALNSIVQYRHLLNESLAMHIEDAGDLTLIREDIMTDVPGGTRQSTDMAVGVLMLIFRAVLGPQWRPEAVHFTHAPPAELPNFRRLFRCPLHFDSDFNGLVCLSMDMDRPNLQADQAMARYAQSFMDAIPKPGQSTVMLDVRRSVYLLLPMGRASVEQVASGLGMNVRTLQRRLGDSGMSFSDVLNEVRCELAQRYVVHTGYPIARVAELLGYSNQSSFTRWYTAQFGRAPSAMREPA